MSNLCQFPTSGRRTLGLVLGSLLLATSVSAQISSDDDEFHLHTSGLGQGLTSVSDLRNTGAITATRPSVLVPEVAGERSEHGKVELPDVHHPVADPLTEYQTFVQTSAGMQLPIFGASLFNDVPTTFAPLDRIPVTPDYTVGPGDELELRVWGQINANERLLVDRSGDVYLPQVGRMSVAGLRFIDLQPFMKTSIGRVFRNFEMTVNMGQLRSIQVFVMGRARRPGTYTVSSLSTLINALFASGGPSPQGSMRDIQVKRGGRVITTFDLYDLLLRGDKSRDVSLQPGDVIYIPKAGPRVAIGGSVETAAIYEVMPNTSLRDVLGYAGGLSSVAAGQHAILERVDSRATLVSQNLALTEAGLDTSLQDGDIVKLLQVIPGFTKTVTLKGNVADAVRLPWYEGMKVSDVIPDKRALLTRQYWIEHNQLTHGSAGHADILLDPRADRSLASSMGEKAVAAREFGTKNDVKPPAPDINWSYAAVERLDAQSLTTHLIAFSLGKIVLEHDAAADVTLQPGDVITIFSKADFLTPMAEQTRFVRLEGEVKMAGVYSVEPGETLRQLVARAGGLTDKAYLYGAQLTRESTRREQEARNAQFIDELERSMDQASTVTAARAITADREAQMRAGLERQREMLERMRGTPATGRIVLAVQPDSSGVASIPDLPLENNDRLVVPSTPCTVEVVGTVYNQGSFMYKSGDNALDYLKQAGGPTRTADKKQMFVIRADGSVWSKTEHSSFDSTAINPGDTLVVPALGPKGSLARNFFDWTQGFSGLGVTAASANVLR